MSTVTIHLADEQHERLKALASARGTSLDKLFDTKFIRWLLKPCAIVSPAHFMFMSPLLSFPLISLTTAHTVFVLL